MWRNPDRYGFIRQIKNAICVRICAMYIKKYATLTEFKTFLSCVFVHSTIFWDVMILWFHFESLFGQETAAQWQLLLKKIILNNESKLFMVHQTSSHISISQQLFKKVGTVKLHKYWIHLMKSTYLHMLYAGELFLRFNNAINERCSLRIYAHWAMIPPLSIWHLRCPWSSGLRW